MPSPQIPVATLPALADATLIDIFSMLETACDTPLNWEFNSTSLSGLRTELAQLAECLYISADSITVQQPAKLQQRIGVLARMAAFGPAPVRLAAHRITWSIALELGIFPASIDQLYRATDRHALRRQVTVPAINMRAIAYESARGVFQAMREACTSAVIFELSRGEIGFTNQRPHEYATAILCAAIAEGHSGPVFLQGDHFQISASQYEIDADAEFNSVAALIKEAISAGFFNIDIDTSTLVDLSESAVVDQQRLSVAISVRLASLAREFEPFGLTISLGGEIGEVGEHNSTLEELQAYLEGVASGLPRGCAGLSKISIQSGTRHGGNVLADGSFGEMPIDFTLIDSLSQACRDQFGVGGCVQHGASMLSTDKLGQLPAAGCIEVHLAAGFLNDVYDNLPEAHLVEIDQWLKDTFSEEWKVDWSEAQFLHHARRYAVGPSKRAWWDDNNLSNAVRQAVKERAALYFQALAVENTLDLVRSFVTHAPVGWIAPPADLSVAHSGESYIRDLAS